MGSRKLQALIGGVVVAGALGLAASPAQAAIQCGDVIKKDIKLKRNLNCTGSGTDGLIIGRHGVTIDLNGKTLRGPEVGYAGIDNSSGWDRVTIKNGKLRGWSPGIEIDMANRATVRNVEIRLGGTNDHTGIDAEYSVRPVIRNVTVDNAYHGAYLYDTVNQKVVNLKVTGSDPSVSYGIYGGYMHGVVNKLRSHRATTGLYAYGETPKLLIKNSAANKTGYAGFYISNGTPLARHNYILKNNTATNAGEYGFVAGYDVDGNGNKAKGAGTQNCYNVPCGRK